MMRKTIALLAACLFLVAACSKDSDKDGAAEDTGFPTGTVIMKGEGEPVLVNVEVADEPDLQEKGLMGRESLPEDHGMVFIFFEPTTNGFWMKDTLIPLSVAFFDQDNTILDIIDMEPCKADPCQIYGPGVPYTGALEVNQGMFEEWGIQEGDDIRLVHDDRDKLQQG